MPAYMEYDSEPEPEPFELLFEPDEPVDIIIDNEWYIDIDLPEPLDPYDYENNLYAEENDPWGDNYA